MTIGENSAALGVPRGSIRNLGALSLQAQQHGTATTHVSSSTAWSPGGYGWGRPSYGTYGGAHSSGMGSHSSGVHSTGGVGHSSHH
jgi:hypothetical protein